MAIAESASDESFGFDESPSETPDVFVGSWSVRSKSKRNSISDTYNIMGKKRKKRNSVKHQINTNIPSIMKLEQSVSIESNDVEVNKKDDNVINV